MTRRGGGGARRAGAPALGPKTEAGHLSSSQLQRAPVPVPASAELPADVLLLIVAAARLRGWELARLVCVCRGWRAALSAAAPLWRAALAHDFAPGVRPDADDAAEVRRVLREVTPAAMWYAGSGCLFELSRALRSCEARLQLQRDADAHADAHVAPPREWAAVRVAERPTGRDAWRCACKRKGALIRPPRLTATHARLASRWRTASQPYILRWLPPGAPARRDALAARPRRLHLPAELRSAADAAADYRLYTAFAAALLRGRCRACNCVTGDVHGVLRVPLCATPACGGAFRAAAAAAAAAAGAGGGGAAAAAARAAPWRPRRAAAAHKQQTQAQTQTQVQQAAC
jgi:hypothetical protein